jgi:hypothetical protein
MLLYNIIQIPTVNIPSKMHQLFIAILNHQGRDDPTTGVIQRLCTTGVRQDVHLQWWKKNHPQFSGLIRNTGKSWFLYLKYRAFPLDVPSISEKRHVLR